MPLAPEQPRGIVPSMTEGARFQLLGDIIQGINQGRTLDEVLDLIWKRLSSFVPYDRIAIAVTDPKKERLSIIAARSDGKIVLNKGYTGAIAGSTLEPLIREGRTRILNDLQEYLRKKPQSDSTRLIVKEGMRSSLTLPLLVQGTPVGVMFFSSREVDVYKPEHEEFLRTIVGHVAVAIEKSRLIDELREKGEFLENILQNSADAIIVLDMQNRVRTWNNGAQKMFGYEAGEVLGKNYIMFIPPELRDTDEVRKIKRRVEKEGYLTNYECIRLTKDGRRIINNVTSTLLRDKSGRPIGRSSIVRDVTHLKRLRDELVRNQSLAAVGELAATVAHEIKNPLAGISGAIQVLQDAIPVEDQRRSVVSEILDQIKRLDNTVRDLLDFARPTTLDRHDIKLAESLGQAWSLLAPQPAASKVTFDLEGSDGVRISADPQCLHQVWVNLFQNAIEAMPDGGDLTVRVRTGERTVIAVADTGKGVKAEEEKKIFNPFFSTKTRGSGLGLAISRKIVEAHGGTIRFESFPGKGTTVTVEI